MIHDDGIQENIELSLVKTLAFLAIADDYAVKFEWHNEWHDYASSINWDYIPDKHR